MGIINMIRPRKVMAVGAFGALGLGFMPMQCAPQTCAEKPSAVECAPPDAQRSPSGTSGTATAGKQFLQEAKQTLLQVVLLCQGDYHWTYGPATNADNVSGPTVSSYWSCYPRQAAAVTYATSHS